MQFVEKHLKESDEIKADEAPANEMISINPDYLKRAITLAEKMRIVGEDIPLSKASSSSRAGREPS